MTRVTFSLTNFDNIEYKSNNNFDRYITNTEKFHKNTINSNLQIKTSIDEFQEDENNENIFYKELLKKNFKKKDYCPKSLTELSLHYLKKNKILVPKNKLNKFRTIEKEPYKILDVPNLKDDFYLNIIDWSEKNNIGVALGNKAYCWNYNTNDFEILLKLKKNNLVSCLKWNRAGDYIAVGDLTGQIRLIDCVKKKKIIELKNHSERVGAISICKDLIVSGSKDNKINLYDLRISAKPIKVYKNHNQEVCGIKWSQNGDYFASGGNDNKLFVFSPNMKIPLLKKKHKAAVKSISWSPVYNNLLASGSGSADRCIRLFDIKKNRIIKKIDTGSQICNLLFTKKGDEIISTHGYSKNSVCVWKTKGLQKICELKGHKRRVLYLSLAPDGKSFVTGAGDETMRFWDLGFKKNLGENERGGFTNFNRNDIR